MDDRQLFRISALCKVRPSLDHVRPPIENGTQKGAKQVSRSILVDLADIAGMTFTCKT